jgi:hypothetical protein
MRWTRSSFAGAGARRRSRKEQHRGHAGFRQSADRGFFVSESQGWQSRPTDHESRKLTSAGRFCHPWGVSRLTAAAFSNATGFLVSGSVRRRRLQQWSDCPPGPRGAALGLRIPWFLGFLAPLRKFAYLLHLLNPIVGPWGAGGVVTGSLGGLPAGRWPPGQKRRQVVY